jgi:TRAP-type C4-dicarboxylate transport system permease small subunit
MCGMRTTALGGIVGLARAFVSGVDGLNRVLTVAAGLALGVVALAVMAQVMVRFVLTAAGLNISAPWTEELARYALIWMVFIGAAIGVRHARMIALEFGIRRLSPRFGVPLKYAVIALGMAFFVLLLVVGIDFVALGRTETSPVMGITKDRVYWALPVGMVLMLLNSLALVVETVLERRDIRFAADLAPGD